MPTITQVVSMLQTDQPNRRDRTPIYKGIASLLWMQYQVENDITRTPLEHAPADFKRALMEHAEAITNWALNPDLRDTALMAMADDLIRSSSGGSLTAREACKQTQQSYLVTAESAMQAFLLTLKTDAPDPAYRDSMCRLIDSLAPKTGVM